MSGQKRHPNRANSPTSGTAADIDRSWSPYVRRQRSQPYRLIMYGLTYPGRLTRTRREQIASFLLGAPRHEPRDLGSSLAY